MSNNRSLTHRVELNFKSEFIWKGAEFQFIQQLKELVYSEKLPIIIQILIMILLYLMK